MTAIERLDQVQEFLKRAVSDVWNAWRMIQPVSDINSHQLITLAGKLESLSAEYQRVRQHYVERIPDEGIEVVALSGASSH